MSTVKALLHRQARCMGWLIGKTVWVVEPTSLGLMVVPHKVGEITLNAKRGRTYVHFDERAFDSPNYWCWFSLDCTYPSRLEALREATERTKQLLDIHRGHLRKLQDEIVQGDFES